MRRPRAATLIARPLNASVELNRFAVVKSGVFGGAHLGGVRFVRPLFPY